MPSDHSGAAPSGDGFRPSIPVDLVEDDEGLQVLLSHLNLSYTSPEQQVQQADPYHGLPLYALPDEQFLEASVLPLLLRGLEEVATARPRDPLAFLGAYLITNNPQRRAVAPSLLQETWSESEKQAYTAAMTGSTAASSRPGSRKGRAEPAAASSAATSAATAPPVPGSPTSTATAGDVVLEKDWFQGTTRRRKVPLMECAYRAASQFDAEYLAEMAHRRAAPQENASSPPNV